MRDVTRWGGAGREHDAERRGAAAVLLVGAGALLVAGSGFRPLTRRWPAALAASVPALLATEAPRPTAAVTLALSGWSLRRAGTADPRSTSGALTLAGLALTSAATVGLVALDRRARRVDLVLAAALRHGGLPGSSAHDGSGPGAPGRPPPPPRWPGWRAVRRFREAGARDVAYGPHGVANTLDVWRRPDLPADARAPVFLQVHGGAWSSGRKEDEALPLLSHLVDRGWVAVAVNYRLGPAARWPAMIDDVRRALAWTREHVAGYGGDPDRLVVGGGSAGAHLAALAALTPDVGPDPGTAGTPVAAAVTSYGIYDLTSDDGSGTLEDLLVGTMMPAPLAEDPGPWTEASPHHRAGPDAPPFFVLHGSGDAVVAPAQSRAFVRRLRAVSAAPVVYAELPHAQHAFDTLPTARTLRCVRAVETFLDAVLGERGAGVTGGARRVVGDGR